jgi:hypothetical protein
MGCIKSVGDSKGTIELPALPKPVRKSRKQIEAVSKILSPFRAATNIAGVFVGLPKSVSIAAGATKFPGVLSVPFVAKDTIAEAIKVCTKEKVVDKVKAMCNVIVNTSSMTDSVAGTFSFLEKINVIGECATKWIPIVNIISFVVGFISLGLASDSLRQSVGISNLLHEAKKNLHAAHTNTQRAAAIVDILCDIQARGITPTRKKLFLSKNADLEHSIYTLTDRLLTSKGIERKKAIGEGTVLVQTLAQRARVELGFNAANVANKILGIIGSVLLFIPPLIPVGIIILAASTLATFVLWSGKSHFINRNPFDEKSASNFYRLYERMADSLKGCC